MASSAVENSFMRSLFFGEIREDLETLQLQAPAYASGAEFLSIWRDWSPTLMKSLASGKYPVRSGETRLGTQLSKGPMSARRRAG